MVLCGRAHHRGAANVDIFDNFVAVCAAGDGRLKRIEIDDHQIDCADAMLLHRGCMFRIVANAEEAAVHLRMQGLDAAVHHLWKTGEVGDIAHVMPELAQFDGRAAGRHQFDAVAL
jgi:hypothetical protein